DTEAARLPRDLIPALPKVAMATNRLDRRFAALRVIEALRLYAFAHDGQLPEQLSQITAVPVPNDPGTDKPFDYKRDGPNAVLISRVPDQPPEYGQRYRLEIRKK